MAVLILLMAALWLSAPSGARAQALDLSDPHFKDAVRLWLEDDDAYSLPVLADLARKGHRAARLFVSRIEVTDRGPSGYVWSLNRDQRFNLFRVPGGASPFRSSWIAKLAREGDALAVALHAGLAQGINLSAVQRLYDLGEVEAAEHLVRKIAVDGSDSDRRQVLRIIGAGSELEPFVAGFMTTRRGEGGGRQALARILGRPVSDDDPASEMAVKYVEYGYQSGTGAMTFAAENRHFPAIGAWTAKAPEMTVVRRVCASHCASEPERRACQVTALGLLGGYHEVIRFDTPLEAVVPQSQYLKSARARNMVRRRIAGARTEEGFPVMPVAELAKRSACLERAVRGMAAEPN